jgi:low temperature requirement protein LtrA
LELFFDLAFVLVLAELAANLREGVHVQSLAEFAGLFAVVWWAWMSSTLYANRFDHDDVIYRLNKLTSMLAVVGLAASASDATGKYVTQFILCYVALRVLLLLQYGRAYRHVAEARGAVRIYLLATGVGATLWTLSLAVPEPARYVVWAVGVLAEAVGPLGVTAWRIEVPLHLEHLPERFSLFVILVLGESAAAIAHGVHDAHWTAASVTGAALCFVLAATLWWSYFDLAGAAARQLLDEAGAVGSTYSHDIYVYGQLPLCLAIAAAGVGMHDIVVEGGGEASTGSRVLLSGGVALYLVTIGLTNAGMARRGRNGWLWTIVAAVVAVADALFELPALAVTGVLAVVLVAVVIIGLDQEARGNVDLKRL